MAYILLENLKKSWNLGYKSIKLGKSGLFWMSFVIVGLYKELQANIHSTFLLMFSH